MTGLPAGFEGGAELELTVDRRTGSDVVSALRFPGVAAVALSRRRFGATETRPEADVDIASLDAVLQPLATAPALASGSGIALRLRVGGRTRWELRTSRAALASDEAVAAAIRALLELAAASDSGWAAELAAAYEQA